MYFEQLGAEDASERSDEKGDIDKEQMLIFEGDPYMEFPEEEWVAAPVKRGIFLRLDNI